MQACRSTASSTLFCMPGLKTWHPPVTACVCQVLTAKTPSMSESIRTAYTSASKGTSYMWLQQRFRFVIMATWELSYFFTRTCAHRKVSHNFSSCSLSTMSGTIPNLTRIADKVLAICLSTAECERDFSLLKLVKTATRNSLSTKNLEMTMAI